MTPVTRRATDLAYDVEGAGPPILFLHGLTFDRRTWRPVIDALGGSFTSIAVDLPAHGESSGAPAPLPRVAERVGELIGSIDIGRSVIVGHSMSAGLALLVARSRPAAGIVLVEGGPDLLPLAELLHRLEPALRGEDFHDAWQTFERSLGIDLVPEPVRSLVREAHHVRREVVLGYWDMLFRSEPRELQAWFDARILALDVPCLGIFGRPVGEGNRARFARLPDVELEEWTGAGHLVHLVDPARFAARLRRFVERCSPLP